MDNANILAVKLGDQAHFSSGTDSLHVVTSHIFKRQYLDNYTFSTHKSFLTFKKYYLQMGEKNINIRCLRHTQRQFSIKFGNKSEYL